MTEPLVRKITNVEVPVADLARALDWYGQMLGLTVSWRGEREAAVALPEGTAHLFLVETADPQRLGFQTSRYGRSQSVVDLYARGLIRLHAHLREQEVEVTDLPP